MKKYVMLLTYIFALSIHSFDVLNLQNLNIDWKESKGTVKVDHLKFYSPGFGVKTDNAALELEKVGLNYYFNYKDTYFVYKSQASSVIHDLEEVFVDGLKLSYEPGKLLQLESKKARLKQGLAMQDFPAITLRCRKLPEQARKLAHEDITVPCLDAARLEVPEIGLNNYSTQKFNSFIDQKSTKAGGARKLENIVLDIYKKSFNLQLRTKYGIYWKIKARGVVDYLPEKSQIRLHVQYAQAGIFPVTKTLLKQLGKLSINGLKVVGEYVYITI